LLSFPFSKDLGVIEWTHVVEARFNEVFGFVQCGRDFTDERVIVRVEESIFQLDVFEGVRARVVRCYG
jgi:hypothetical protein